MARFKRILLKLSGESLMGNQGHGIDPERLGDYARQIKEVHDLGLAVATSSVDSAARRKASTV